MTGRPPGVMQASVRAGVLPWMTGRASGSLQASVRPGLLLPDLTCELPVSVAGERLSQCRPNCAVFPAVSETQKEREADGFTGLKACTVILWLTLIELFIEICPILGSRCPIALTC